MTKFSLAFLALIAIAISACSNPEPRKIEVLFLGHNSLHHNSEKYLPILASSLANKGINFSYTTRLADLNKENLERYDALMLYANHDSISKSQEIALMDFVEQGGGFLPIHCASYCFRNSEKYVELVGAQFESHGTGVFQAEIVNAEHEITNGFQPFRTWDETYVSQKHNPDRLVLMERVDSAGREPWTWVRDHGKGRVFYTASGHDERTWSDPGFQDLMYRAIIWSVDDDTRVLWSQIEFPTPEYVASADIPNYEKRAEPLPLQLPFSPEDSEKLIQVPAGFQLELFASEPEIINPMFMNWDEKGRLWVIESVDYPNQVDPDGVGKDRIKICEDTDGDGRADKFTVFADGLNIPTSFVFSNGGIIVSAAPSFLFLKDTDGDDRADRRETLITGWGTFDTHAGPSNLKYGFDNYIWGTVGYSAFEGNIANRYYEFGQGIYRFSPDVTDFEYVTSTSNNTWGLGFSETFDVFASTANNAHSWYLGIPDRYFSNLQGIPRVGSKKIANYYAFHPITQNIRQVDVFGGFTAAAGHNLYTARSFPNEYWNQMAFVCEPTGNLLAAGKLVKDGAGFVLEDNWNLLASSDEWVSPVQAEVGPDGAVWVADWYNFIIQHNPTPTEKRGGYDAETGAGNAHVNPLRDKSYGRIYRITHRDDKSKYRKKLDPNSTEDCLEALTDSNLFWRLTAQRLLVEKGSLDIVPQLLELVANKTVDGLGLNPGSLHALWTLHGIGALDQKDPNTRQIVTEALQHPAPGVRKAAIQVLPKTDNNIEGIIESGIMDDPDPHTKLAALLSISEFPPNEKLGVALYEESKDPMLIEDYWLSQALFVAASSHRTGFNMAFENDPDATDYKLEPAKEENEVPSVWNKWDDPESITKDWPVISSGVAWEETDLPEFDGRVIAYKEVQLDQIPETAHLNLGRIGQSDRAFINGTMLHETRNDPQKLRVYDVPVTSLTLGMNYILLTIEDNKGPGGLLGPNESMFLDVGGNHLPIDGEWKYFIQERKSRGINYSEFEATEPLGPRFIAYNQGSEALLSETVQLNPDAIKIPLVAVRNKMTFDQAEIIVSAGEPVQILFENQDLMQHNLLISAPGSLAVVGKAADELATSPDGQEKQYIPEIPQVLFSSPLVNPGETFVLQFTAPEEPGDYPFVCTFPGHWQTMNGLLRVEPSMN